ncbi:hypothetical protein GCM10009634_35710 [Saccharothrix xinjiangensis]
MAARDQSGGDRAAGAAGRVSTRPAAHDLPGPHHLMSKTRAQECGPTAADQPACRRPSGGRDQPAGARSRDQAPLRAILVNQAPVSGSTR